MLEGLIVKMQEYSSTLAANCAFVATVGVALSFTMYVLQRLVFRRAPAVVVNADQYQTLEEVTKALRVAGLEACSLMVGIDYTRSNAEQGLHDMSLDGSDNLYQRVIRASCATLCDLDDDRIIPAFGFGAKEPLFSMGERYGFAGVLEAYNTFTPQVELSGPTNFAPLITMCAEMARERGTFHVLLIICDGAVTSKAKTRDAIVRAAKHSPLAIVAVGVGAGPWEEMREYDDGLPERRWDNFQFVAYREGMSDVEFSLAAMQELPEQFKTCQRLGLI